MAGRQDRGLSSEQIRRMEENKRQAQQRLSNKRVALPSSSSAQTVSQTAWFVSAPQYAQYGPPPPKRPALDPGPSGQQYQHHERIKIIGPPPKLMTDLYSSSSDQSSGASTGSSIMMMRRRPMDSAIASTTYQHPPQTAGGSSLTSSSSAGAGQVGKFYSARDAGPATAVRGTGAVSIAMPNKKVLNYFLV